MSESLGHKAPIGPSAVEAGQAEAGRLADFPPQPAGAAGRLLAALRAAGTTRIHADTADAQELAALRSAGGSPLLGALDGSAATQPLVREVLGRYLERGSPQEWARGLQHLWGDRPPSHWIPSIYTLLCAQLAEDVLQAVDPSRPWEVGVQLHTGLERDPEAARSVGRALYEMVPSVLVTLPFSPHAPDCLLVARDLARAGIPVGFTSIFSVRQAVAAGLLANAARVHVSVGRLNRGLGTALLGERVVLHSQQALRRLRGQTGLGARLVVTGMQDWQAFVRLAGCDIFRAPCAVIRDFLTQAEVPAGEIRSQPESAYEGQVRIEDRVIRALGAGRIERLGRIEPDFIDFLLELRASGLAATLRSGDDLVRRFEMAGFSDFFHAPTPGEWAALRRGTLPDLSAPLTRQLALDTLYSLLADAEAGMRQEAMDREIARRMA
jgi:transaldolase